MKKSEEEKAKQAKKAEDDKKKELEANSAPKPESKKNIDLNGPTKSAT